MKLICSILFELSFLHTDRQTHKCKVRKNPPCKAWAGFNYVHVHKKLRRPLKLLPYWQYEHCFRPVRDIVSTQPSMVKMAITSACCLFLLPPPPPHTHTRVSLPLEFFSSQLQTRHMSLLNSYPSVYAALKGLLCPSQYSCLFDQHL